MARIVFVPGNGGSTTHDNWFPYVQAALKAHGHEVIAATFPDPVLAREAFWIPFLLDELKVDKNTVLIGHSSGAIAAMRFAETHQILGSVLVGTYYTHLDVESEKKSGYFDRPWQWDVMKRNQQWTVVFASQDDPWIPVSEPRFVHQQLNCEYHEYTNQGHFGGDYHKPEFPELVTAVLKNLG